MYGSFIATAKKITHNPNAHKRKQRIALKSSQNKTVTHIADNVYHLTFKVEGIDKEVVVLADLFSTRWFVSECDDFIMGSGVMNKIFRDLGKDDENTA